MSRVYSQEKTVVNGRERNGKKKLFISLRIFSTWNVYDRRVESVDVV